MVQLFCVALLQHKMSLHKMIIGMYNKNGSHWVLVVSHGQKLIVSASVVHICVYRLSIWKIAHFFILIHLDIQRLQGGLTNNSGI